MSVLDRVNYPKDIKTMNIDELNALAGEIRELLIHKIYETGGHNVHRYPQVRGIAR